MRPIRALRAVLRRPLVSLVSVVYDAIWLLWRAGRNVAAALRWLAFWASWPLCRVLARLAPPLRGLRERVGIAAPTPDPALVERLSAAIESFNPGEIEAATLAVLEEFVVPAVHRGMLLTAGRAGRKRLRRMPSDELAEAIFRSCVVGPPCFPPFPPRTHSALAEAVRRYVGAA